MEPKTKTEILNAIRKAKEARLKEQDIYRETINAAMESSITDEHSQQFQALTVEDIDAHMADMYWPPTSQDWDKFKGLKWDQIPRRKVIDKIPDKDIASAIYFYHEIYDHTMRIKASARFYSLSGASNNSNSIYFSIWTLMSMLDTMNHELQTDGALIN